MNCSLTVSTCPARDTAAELLLDATQTLTSLRGRGFDTRRDHVYRDLVRRREGGYSSRSRNPAHCVATDSLLVSSVAAVQVAVFFASATS